MKYVVAEASEIESGGRKIVTVAGRSIGVFNLDGEFFALRNRCPHQAGRLCEGKLWGVIRSERPGDFEYRPSREILCCLHVRTGQSWCAPERLRVRRYDVETVAGEELAEAADAEAAPADDPDAPAPGMVKGPYMAETYPVIREGKYLVVEIPA
ncbi:MAG: Rieske 2Fe-2S domain-containing protein [Acidobacteria bacterium]|nr:Rieske 2Fe-2S domain-containing protein [Acidobacteriota bacterium]